MHLWSMLYMKKKKQTPTHIIFDGHTWIKNTAVNSHCYFTPLVALLVFVKEIQFQLESTLSGISGYMYLHSAYS